MKVFFKGTIALPARATLPLSALASNITGTYLVDTRPTDVLYITLLQSNQTLTGSLVDVVPNGAGATKSDTLQQSGTILNDIMSISAKVWFTNLMTTGRIQCGAMTLSIPPVSD